MTTTTASIIPLTCLAGVEPLTDSTAVKTDHYVYSQNVRFVDLNPEKIGGWQQIPFNNGVTISGKIRSIFSTSLGNRIQTVIGTNTKLYGLSGSTLVNITPLQTTTTAAPNSLGTLFSTLSANPIQTTVGNSSIQITDPNTSLFQVGDLVKIAGATATGGLTTANLNATFLIRAIGVGSYTVNTGVNATSTATGGGSSVTRATQIISLTTVVPHGIQNGDRVQIGGAVATGGIPATSINTQFIARNVSSLTFLVITDTFSTSGTASAGGAATVYSTQIPIGPADETYGQGYGMGLYGAGLYGTALLSTSGRSLPRIWYFDKYGDNIIAAPGNQGGVFTWTGSSTTAPAQIANAPTALNYAFVSDNILVTFGAGGTVNRIYSSDIGNITQWTASSSNQVYDNILQNAGRLLTHVNINGVNVIFTEQRSWTMRYVGGTAVWQIKPLEQIGIIAPMARVAVNGAAVWMGLENFYIYRGGSVDVIQSNSINQSTLLRYVFNNLNFGQKSKIFAWYNKQFNEVWFHYPSASSNECDSVAIVNMKDYTWYPLVIDRTAAEYPELTLDVPRLADSSSLLYQHEVGHDANSAAMAWNLTFNKQSVQQLKTNFQQMALIPDSVQIGDIFAQMNSWKYPQSTITNYDSTYTVSPSTERVPIQLNGRIMQLILSGAVIGQNWQMGDWSLEVQAAGGKSE